MDSTQSSSLTQIAGQQAYDQGVESLNNHAVLDLDIGCRTVKSRVANESGGFERVRLAWPNSHLEAQCSCNWFATPFCRHIVAVILTLYRDNPQIKAALETRASDKFKNSDDSASPKKPVQQPAVQPMSNTSTRHTIRDVISLNPPERATMSLHIQSHAPHLESRWEKLEIIVSLHFSQRTYAASNIKRLIETRQGAGGMRLEYFSIQEQQAMQLLINESRISDNVFTLSSADVADLFHCLADFPYFYSFDGPLQIRKESLTTALEVIPKGSLYRVTPTVQLVGRTLKHQSQFKTVAGRGGSWIGSGTTYWWLPGLTDIHWLRCFTQGQAADFTAAELKKIRDTSQNESLTTTLRAQEEAATSQSIKMKQCQPVLSLDWDQEGIRADLQFQYDDLRIDFSDPKIICTEKGLIQRDLEKEKQAKQRLLKLGFTEAEPMYRFFDMHNPELILNFIENTLSSLSADWLLFYSDSFQNKTKESGPVTVTAETTAENSSEFELQLTPLSPANQILNLDKLLPALKKDSSLFKMDSGAVVYVPPKIQQALQSLAERAKKKKNDRFKFGRYAALPVHETVNLFQNNTNAHWQELCQRLQMPVDYDTNTIPTSLQDVLRDYQKDGVAWMLRLQDCGFHGILADEMGLGKTVQALTLIQLQHLSTAAAEPSMVVCPTSLVENWLCEAHRFTPSLNAAIISGSYRDHQISQLYNYDLLITSYALLRRDIKKYSNITFQHLILDEAQHIKNPDTANAKTCKAIAANQRWILTGTPLENNIRELWSLFDFLMPGMLGSRSFFREHYEKQADNSETTQQLIRQVRPFIMRRTKEKVCHQLPAKMEQLVYCDLYEQQREIYDGLMNSAKQLLQQVKQNPAGNRMECLSILMRLRQVCSLPALLPEELLPDNGESKPSAKMDLLKEIVYECMDSGRRMLLFSQFTKVLKYIAEWLNTESINYEYLDGSTKNRLERVNKFNTNDNIPIFLISLKAGGTGLNLTGADTVIHYDQWWNPMVEDQATDRSHRIGQDKPVSVIKFASRNTVEERILELQDSKRALFQQVLEGTPVKANQLTPEDFEFLLTNT